MLSSGIRIQYANLQNQNFDYSGNATGASHGLTASLVLKSSHTLVAVSQATSANTLRNRKVEQNAA